MPTGLTKDAGWNVGVSRTFPCPLDDVWDAVVSPEGVAVWLGAGALLEDGASYETDDGTVGVVRSLRANNRVRLTWQPVDWSHDSTVQVAVSSSGGRTVLRFHQERLASAAERERQRTHWSQVMDLIAETLDRGQ
ncbi:SRPBCC domain-containing protein [Kribbella sp. NPDC003505]|uniref:SRPBCC family protein n=1 Tax=Kribbella sp. NPDC003505 TaxID=3154448 RepID=UPI0033B33775